MDPSTSPSTGATDIKNSKSDDTPATGVDTSPADPTGQGVPEASGRKPAGDPPAEGLRPGERLRVTLERPAALGRTVGHDTGTDHEGLTLLVSRGLPGETVDVVIEKSYPNFALARALSVEAPAAERSEPPCPHYERCGGCDWQHAAYPAQLEIKRVVLADQFQRIGKMEAPPFEIEPAPEPLGYRDRLDFIPVPEDGRWRPGFHAPSGTSDPETSRKRSPVEGPTVAVDHCRLAPEPLTRIAATLLTRLQDHGTLPSPDAPGLTRLPLVRIIVQGTVRPSGSSVKDGSSVKNGTSEEESAAGEREAASPTLVEGAPDVPESSKNPAGEPGLSLVLQLKSARGEKPRTLRRRWVEVLRTMLPDLRAEFPALCHLALKVIPSGGKEHPSFERVLGSEWLHKEVGEHRYQAPPGGFFQVHPALTGKLVDEVVGAVQTWRQEDEARIPTPVFDIFGGAGLFSLPIGRGGSGSGGVEHDGVKHDGVKHDGVEQGALKYKGAKVVCADNEGGALRAGEQAAKAARLRGVRFERVDLERTGALEALIAAHGSPGALVCDPPRRGLPAPLVAAIKKAAVPLLVYVSCDGGTFARDTARLAPDYEITHLRAFDLFPQTHHLETVAVFKRRA